ncbi:MAG: hypothetical protein ABR524_02645 [Thermoanaerobaculia bacterium]
MQTTVQSRTGDPRRSMTAAGVALAVLWLASIVLWLTPGIVVPDGAGYYVYLPSAILGGDLVFFDEWARIGAIRDGVILFKEVTATDHLGNHWPAGSALVWAPGFVLGHVISSATGGAAGGWSLPYNVATACVSAFAGLLVMFGTWKVAMRWTTPARAAAAAAAGWLGTNLLWYSLVNSLTAHAISAALTTGLVLLSLRLREKCDAAGWLAAGMVGGLACAVRPQNLVLVVIPFVIAWSSAGRSTLVRKLPWYALGGILGASPQLLVSWVLYGNPLGFTYFGDSSPGTPFASFARLWWWEPLFSWYHGLFIWTPVALVGVAGFAALWRRDRRLALSGIWVFLSFWAINATMERSFWGGFAFGQRKFDALIPFIVIGLGALIAARPVISLAAIAPACVWTVLLMFASRSELDLNSYQTGSELAAAAARAVVSAGEQLRFLSAVPPVAKPTVALVAIVTLLMLALVFLGVRRLRFGVAIALLVAYLAAADVWILWVARNDAAAIEPWRPLLESNRGSDSPGAIGMRMDLLQRELAYLRRSGRDDEAARTEAEIRRIRPGTD